MFCSSCGKTLKLPADRCPNCGAPIGESRFEGVPYTSAQARIAPGGSPNLNTRNYTRTTYSGMSADRGDPDTRTTYRPAYDDNSVPEEIRDGLRAQLDNDQMDIPDEVDEIAGDILDMEFTGGDSRAALDGIDMSELRSRPITSRGQKGISTNVNEYIQKIENERERKSEKKGILPTLAMVRPQAAEEDAFSTEPDTDDYDEIGGQRAQIGGRAMQMIKIAAGLLIVMVIAVGITMWVRHVAKNSEKAPIEGVTLALYNEGVAKIEQHAGSEHGTQLLNQYRTDGILSLTTQLSADAAEFSALVPAEPLANDALFIQALETIQENIGNALTMDALALAQPTDTAAADSQARWQIISSAIAQLKAATTAAQLTAIVGGEKISIQTAEPSPSPTPVVYNTLTRGDKNENVLRMQTRLWELGFLQDDRDGNFGGNTATAVKAFQQAAGLDVTGIADNKTLVALYADDAPRTGNAQPTPAPTPAPTPEPTPEPDADAGQDGDAAQ